MSKTRNSNKRSRQEQKSKRSSSRQDTGNQLLAADARKKQFDNDWKLDWFSPINRQNLIIDSIDDNIFTIVDGSSGVGKTTTALWAALCGLRDGSYNQLIFAKNPTEVGDDKIGYLTGGETDKLLAHFDTSKRIFHEFMSLPKLENDLGSGKIRLTIPNFLLGATFDNAIVLIDEIQTMSPSTVKLLLERCGVGTRYILLGDSYQTYSISKRVDGFKDLIHKTTKLHHGIRESKSDFVGYVRLTSEENQRSEGSRFITNLYENNKVI